MRRRAPAIAAAIELCASAASRGACCKSLQPHEGREIPSVLRRYRGLSHTRRGSTEEPIVLEGSPTDRLLQPGVVTARSHLEHRAHHSNVEALAVGFEKFVGLMVFPVLAFVRIGMPPRR